MKSSRLHSPALARRLALDGPQRFLTEAHREFAETMSRYWDADVVSVSVGGLPAAGPNEQGIMVHAQKFTLLVTPPKPGARIQWRAFVVECETVVWHARFNSHLAVLEAAIVGTASALKQPSADLAATFTAAKDSAGTAIQGKWRQLSALQHLGMTLGECALALGAPPDRVALWHRRLGRPIPPAAVSGIAPRLIDRIRARATAGEPVVAIAQSVGVDAVGVARAIEYLGRIDAARRHDHQTMPAESAQGTL